VSGFWDPNQAITTDSTKAWMKRAIAAPICTGRRGFSCSTGTNHDSGKCYDCRGHAGDHLVSVLAPKHPLPFPLDPDVPLPCWDRWDEHDGEYVTPEIQERCAECPIAAQAWCLQFALLNNTTGVWAATNSKDRDLIRRQEAAETEESAA